MKIRKNDEVIVIAGKERGKTGKVLSIKKDRATVAGLNMIQKHVKPTQTNPDGGIRKMEGTIHISNLAHFIKGKDGGASKVRYEIKDGKKVRVLKRNNKVL
ncbi:MAG: 50S ribosomal protein L24 [Mycoplasma sp.]|nr:50S ribosomal protein L24 [Mycoplasma sp.]